MSADGFCACGCGQRTTIAPHDRPDQGRVKGQPIRFIHGHNSHKQHYVVEPRGYDTPCWIWQLTKSKDGHGRLVVPDGRFRMAHIVYWEKLNGSVTPGHVLHHECRVTSCVNPEHLTPMSHAEHQRLHTGKITMADAAEIRRRYVPRKVSMALLGREFGISQERVWAIIHGKSWVEESEQVAA